MLLVWSLGTYQAFAPFFITLTAISFVTVFLSGKRRCSLREALQFMALFIVGLSGYYLLANLTAKLTGASSAYVDAMFMWGQKSFQDCLETIRLDFERVYCDLWPVFFKRAYGEVVFSLPLYVCAAGSNRKQLTNVIGYGLSVR